MAQKNTHVVFTIIAKNYIKYALLLSESYKKFYPDNEFYVIFDDNMKVDVPGAISVNVDEIDTIPRLEYLKFKYNILEFSTAIKPFVFSWLEKKHNPETIIYFDPDIYIFKPLTRIYDELKNHDCVLTPHLNKPYDDNNVPNEYDIFKSGLYNLGFGAFAVNKNTSTYFKWWGQKVFDYGYSDPENHMFTDQKWMDFAPSYMDTYLLREQGYNVAYWNLHEYIKKFDPKDVVFFHFSGLGNSGKYVSKYQNRYTFEQIGNYDQMYDFYKKKLHSLDKYDDMDYHYPYNFFSNGVEVSNAIREIYEYLVNDEGMKFDSPFEVEGKKSFYNFLMEPIKNEGDLIPLRIFEYLYTTQPLIQITFPNIDLYDDSRLVHEYLKWVNFYAKNEYQIPSEFIKEQKKYISVNFSYPSVLKVNMGESMRLISSVEKLKNQSNNKVFVERIYKVILGRNVDSHGLEKNVSDLLKNKHQKNLISYRLLKSEEFRTKKSGDTLLISLYRLYLMGLIGMDKIRAIVMPESTNSATYESQPVIKKQEVKQGINIAGYLDTESGVGESARGIIRALQKENVPIHANNIEQPWLRRSEKEFADLFTKKNDYFINVLCVNADQTRNVVLNDLGKNYLGGKYNVGYWYWEGDIFPEDYFDAFELLNEVWVATDYVYEALNVVSPIPVIKIPPAFIAHPAKKFPFEKYKITIEKDDFVFLNLFDSASFWERKNPFAVIKAFKKASKENPKMKLIIKTTKIKEADIYPRLEEEIGDSKQIILLDSYLPSDEVYSLINSVDAYVALHRSEGLGIPIIDSMLAGKPVIATDFGGNRDFMNSSNSYLVSYTPHILKKAIGPYEAGTVWADANTDEAAAYMVEIVQDPKKSAAKGEKAKEFASEYFSPKRIGQLIEKRLAVIKQ